MKIFNDFVRIWIFEVYAQLPMLDCLGPDTDTYIEMQIMRYLVG